MSLGNSRRSYMRPGDSAAPAQTRVISQELLLPRGRRRQTRRRGAMRPLWNFFSLAVVFLELALVDAANMCIRPKVKFLQTKMKKNSPVAQFACRKSATLVGPSEVSCVDGAWETELPVCIPPNILCPPLVYNKLTTHVTFSFRGAIARSRCRDGYRKEDGVDRVHCIGKKWSGKLPECHKMPPTSQPREGAWTKTTISGASSAISGTVDGRRRLETMPARRPSARRTSASTERTRVTTTTAAATVSGNPWSGATAGTASSERQTNDVRTAEASMAGATAGDRKETGGSSEGWKVGTSVALFWEESTDTNNLTGSEDAAAEDRERTRVKATKREGINRGYYVAIGAAVFVVLVILSLTVWGWTRGRQRRHHASLPNDEAAYHKHVVSAGSLRDVV